MTKFIMVTYNPSYWSTREEAPLFAATLAAKMSEYAEVTLIDGTHDARALKHFGYAPLTNSDDASTNQRFWDSVAKGNPNETHIFLGPFGDLGDDVSAIHVATQNPHQSVRPGDKKPKTRSKEEIISLFRFLEGDGVTDVALILAQSGSPLMIAGLGFANAVLHMSESDSVDSYKGMLMSRDQRRGKNLLVVPVFYGTAPNRDIWRNEFPPKVSRQLIMSHSWNDPILDELAAALGAGNGWRDTLDGTRDSVLSSISGTEGLGEEKKSKSIDTSSVKTPALLRLASFTIPPAGAFGAYVFATALEWSVLAPLMAGAVAIILAVTGVEVESSWKEKKAQQIEDAEKSKATPAQIEPSYSELWRELEERRAKVVDSWVEYELNASLGLRYPTMLDSSVPATGAFHKALGKVEMLERTKDETVSPVGTPYFDAVQELELSFKVAEEHARKMGRSVWSAEQRPKVEKAERLLAMAMDESASTNERQNAYRQALASLEGVASIPQKAAHRIEAAIALIEA